MAGRATYFLLPKMAATMIEPTNTPIPIIAKETSVDRIIISVLSFPVGEH
jgi:hypothetical protein